MNGQWQDQPACVGSICIDGVCSADCVPGQSDCSGNAWEVCGPDGWWDTPPVPCVDQTCLDGMCVGVCAPGQTQCSGNGLQTCGLLGQWDPPTACPVACCANKCTDTASDAENCGSCGHACAAMQTCSASVCN
jgi:hypothetical protein